MKSFRQKGKGGSGRFSKGAKHKRFLWKNNKNKSNYQNKANNDDDDNRVNQNLICEDNMYQSDDEPPPAEKGKRSFAKLKPRVVSSVC